MTAPAGNHPAMMEAAGSGPHVAAGAVAVNEVGWALLTHLALVSGSQGRCKAPCSCSGPSSKPRLWGNWTLTCGKGNSHKN